MKWPHLFLQIVKEDKIVDSEQAKMAFLENEQGE